MEKQMESIEHCDGKTEKHRSLKISEFISADVTITIFNNNDAISCFSIMQFIINSPVAVCWHSSVKSFLFNLFDFKNWTRTSKMIIVQHLDLKHIWTSRSFMLVQARRTYLCPHVVSVFMQQCIYWNIYALCQQPHCPAGCLHVCSTAKWFLQYLII